MRFPILLLIAILLSSCSYKLTLMPRDGGSVYYGKASGIRGHGDLSVNIDGATYSGTWIATKNPGTVTVINTSHSDYSSPMASAMASSSAVASAAMASSSGGNSGTAILSSPEGRGLRCGFQYSGSVGNGVCVDDNGRLYDMQIILGIR